MKRFFAFLLALVLLIGAVPAMPVSAAETEELPAAEPVVTEPAEPEVTEPEVTEPERTVTEQTVIVDTDLPGNDALFAGYVEQVFYGEAATFGTAAGKRLTGNTKLLYDALVPILRQIAAGQRASTVIGVGPEQDINGEIYPSDVDITFGEDAIDRYNLISALLTDLPYELYWFDKTQGCSFLSVNGYGPEYVQLSFAVAGNYAADTYKTDTAITSAAAAAVGNAQDILANNASKSDFEKLTAYKDTICQLVSYEDNYGDYTTDNDPWQLIHVFDGDSSTNVVCEGYSKAFMYLCDQSTFTSDVTCVTVSGDMGGNHMWNIVEIGSDSYLVDVTNSEPGTVGQNGNLFLAGGTGSPAQGYTVAGHAYAYDEDTIALWGTDADSILTLAAENYSPNAGGNEGGSEEPTPCQHTYGDWETVTPATCTAPGSQQHTCTLCGNVETQDIPKVDHAYENGSCTLCGAADDSIPEPPQSIGEGLAWALDESGKLMISGTGAMVDFQEGITPWQNQAADIKTVELAKGVTCIGAYAFAGCTNLTEVILPDTVTAIGAYAFSGSGLQKVIFCGTQMQWSALGYDPSNTELDTVAVQYHNYGQWQPFQPGTCIEPGVEQRLCDLCGHVDARPTDFGDHAFVDDVCIHCGMLYLPVPEGLTYTISNGEVTLTGYTGTNPELIIPTEIEGKPVTAIRDFAFENNTVITFVSLPNTLTQIGNSAFKGCKKLKDIAIPENVKEIHAYAFYDCTSLTSIFLPDSVTYLASGTFGRCKKLELAVLGKGIRSLEPHTFADCSSLRCIAFTSSLTKIKSEVFYGCTALECCVYLGSESQLSRLSVSDVYNGPIFDVPVYLEGTCCPPVVKASTDSATGKPKLVWGKEACAIGYAIFRSDSADGEYEYLDVTDGTSYVDTTAQNGKRYYYIVVGISPYGKLGFDSNVVSSSSKCAAPILTTSNKASTGKPVISWEAVYGAAKYEVYRATSKSGKYTKVKTTTATSYTDTDTSAGKTYYYKVKTIASSSKNNSGYSDVVSQLCICAQPATTLTTASATGKPVISWKKVSGASKYEVYRSFTQDGEFELLATTAELTYTDKTAPVDTDCWYKVNAIASSAARNSIDAEPKLIHSTIAQPNVTTKSDAATGKPVLSWPAVEGAANYKVYRATKSSGTYTELGTTEELTFTDTTATRGKTYYYKVRAYNATCQSAYSSVDSCACRNAAPVITVSPKASTGKPVVKWEKISGATKYEVYRATSEGGKYSLVKTTTSTSYTDTKATAGKTYFYKVRALASSSTYKSAYSTIVPGLTICAQPSVTLAVSSTTGKPVISWGKVSGASQYEVYRSDAQDGTYELLTTTTALTYTDAAAAVDTAYWYKINAIAANTACNSVDGTPKTIHATIAKPAVTAAPDAATGKPVLSWPDVEGATSYNVYRATKKSGTYKAIATVTDPTYTDTAASRGRTYYYKVKAYGENCQSAYSSIDSCASRNLAPTVTVAASASSGKPVISWNKISGTKNYQVYRSTSESGSYTKVKTTTSTSFTDTSAAVGTTYYYKVRSVASSSTYTGAFSQAEACLCVCARPSVTVSVDSTSGKPYLSWKAVSGAAGYRVYRMDALGNEELLAEQSTVTFLDTSAAPDSDYSYKVNTLGASAQLHSADGSYKAVHSTLAKPVVTAAPDAATGKPVLSWDAVEGAATYKVYRATKKSGTYKAVATVTDPTYTDTNASRGRTYYYKVRAYGENCTGAYSSIDSCACRNAQPVVTVTVNDAGKPVLTWTKVSGTKNYQVYRATAPDGTFTKLKTTTSLKFTDSAPAEGVTYYYKVRSVASSSTYTGAFSQVVEFTLAVPQ